MEEVTLARSRRLLDYTGGYTSDSVMFSNAETMGEECATTIALPRADWIEFDEPKTLTVTILPGDHLNSEPTPSSYGVAEDLQPIRSVPPLPPGHTRLGGTRLR